MNVRVDVDTCIKFTFHHSPDRNVLLTRAHDSVHRLSNLPLMRKHTADILRGSDIPNHFATFLKYLDPSHSPTISVKNNTIERL